MQQNPENLPWAERWLGLKPISADVVRMTVAVQSWVGRALRNNRQGTTLLVLWSPTGAGKTMALHGAHRFVAGASLTAFTEGWWTHQPIAREFYWPEFVTPSASWMADDAKLCDIAFLDDVGAEVDQYRNGATTELLARILSHRERKWTMITTNVPEDRWSERWDERVADRLHRDAEIVAAPNAASYSRRNL